MDSKPLLYGLIGFFMGGLLVSIAATTFDKPIASQTAESSMTEMAAALQTKTGDDYDKTFIKNMIYHHQSAVDMAKLSANSAKHDEIRQLSNEIILDQEKEIGQMQEWAKRWNYEISSEAHSAGH